jgi:hypothetical protein
VTPLRLPTAAPQNVKSTRSMSKQQAQIDYYLILHAWNQGEPIATVYGMILRWIENYLHLILAKDEVFHILKRVGEEDMEPITEDFVHGRVYPKLRLEFTI